MVIRKLIHFLYELVAKAGLLEGINALFKQTVKLIKIFAIDVVFGLDYHCLDYIVPVLVENYSLECFLVLKEHPKYLALRLLARVLDGALNHIG